MGFGIVLSALLLLVIGLVARAATADDNLSRLTGTRTIVVPMAGGVKIWRDRWVGKNPGGYAKPFVAGDEFLGLAPARFDNTAGSDGAINCTVEVGTVVVYTLASVAQKDIGRPVYATADDALAFTGHFDAYVGRVDGVAGTNLAYVRIKRPGERPPADGSSTEIVWDGSKMVFGEVLTAGNEQFIGGAFRLDAIGAGITSGAGIAPVPTVGETKMLLDNDNEAQNVTIETPAVFNVTKAITMDFEGRLSVAGGAATDDVDFGIAALSTTGLTDTERANMDAATAGLKSCKFHLDANANDVFASSDDDASPVAAADTTFDNELGTNHKFKIIARTNGACEIWIDGVRKLATTAFAVSASGLFCGFVNLEKSTGMGVPRVQVKSLRMAGALA